MLTWNQVHKKVCSDAWLLSEALDKAIDGVLLTSPRIEDNPIVYVSKGFINLTGYNEEEILGKNCRFLQGAETDAEIVKQMRQAVENGESFSGEILNYKKTVSHL